MNFIDAIENVSTKLELSRFASAYLSDQSRMGTDELLVSLKKTLLSIFTAKMLKIQLIKFH